MGLKTWLRQRLNRRLGVPTVADALERAQGLGLQVRCVFDIGAYHGDFAQLARRLWPSAALICFEPLPGPRARLASWAQQQPDVRIYDCLLGATATQAVPFHEIETASSVLSERVNTQIPVRMHRMRTLDEVCESEGLQPLASLIKLDVQGYELEVLRGAEHCLASAEALLLEVNLLDLHAGVPLMTEVVAWLDARGFVAYDICALTRRPLDQALWQADVLFVRESSPLRSDKRWGT